MVPKLAKYFLLLFFAIATILQEIPFGDYSDGILNGLLFLFFGLMFTLIFIYTFIKNIYLTFRKGNDFDFIPTIIFFVTITLIILAKNSQNGKFWSNTSIVAEINNPNISGGNIVFYENGSFAAKKRQIEFSNVWQGDYKLQHDTLTLFRNDLPKLSDGMFTTKYIMNLSTNKIEPIEKSFDNMTIINN